MTITEELFDMWFKEYGLNIGKDALDDKSMKKVARGIKSELKSFRPYLYRAWLAGCMQRKFEEVLEPNKR